ncbi:hypothetical protein GCM10023320_26790 [Pseudonocardia adelaidensis]|uniref:Uncharacterized protein n=1 Tax=Pseudonocardia adelaidensis TaxID=648754 RepID=A0ABP9NJ88_9PSEU
MSSSSHRRTAGAGSGAGCCTGSPTPHAPPAATGYELVQWTGNTPADRLDDMAALKARMSTDPPLDDLHYGPEQHDADRIRARDGRSTRRWATAPTTGWESGSWTSDPGQVGSTRSISVAASGP